MLAFVLVIGVTACGNSSGQSVSRQDTKGQIDNHPAEDRGVDSSDGTLA